MNNTIVGVDLAKHVIQVCIVKQNKIVSNREMSSAQFTSWLANVKPATIVFEACSTSNYWKQTATRLGHDARLVSARLVAKIRQNQKTDRNDALAIVQASQLVNTRFINGKSFSQQELQSLMRMRELAIKQKVALKNQIQALLLEFNIRVHARLGGLNAVIQQVLEDADNGFCLQFRQGLQRAWQSYLSTVESITEYDKLLGSTMEEHADCEKLTALEGVSVINAVNLYIELGCGDAGFFRTGQDASACIGLTPLQHSTGGKARIGSISKRVKNSSLRSYLVSGAMAVVNQVSRREPRTAKEQWLKQLIERRGKRCAAVALANKTVRTAFAMLTQGTEYRPQPLKA